jgi:hypothetical protein
MGPEQQLLLFLARDSTRPGQHWWVTPGGGLQIGESFEEAASRELHEETGLRAHGRNWQHALNIEAAGIAQALGEPAVNANRYLRNGVVELPMPAVLASGAKP